MIGEEEKDYFINQLEEKHNQAKEEQNKVVKNGQKVREDELMDKYAVNIECKDNKA